MDFEKFANMVQNKFATIAKHDLYVVDVERNELNDVYLSSFPAGTNPIYKEKTEHDCSACRKFIRDIGNVVTINTDYTIDTVWNISDLEYPYNIVAQTLHEYVLTKPIKNAFCSKETTTGVRVNRQKTEDTVITWHHLFTEIPKKFIDKNKDSLLSKKRSRFEVHKRSLDELEIKDINTILELIHDNMIYRGAEFKKVLEAFKRMKNEYISLPVNRKEIYAWVTSNKQGAGIRNTVIGTLLSDLADGKNVEEAVKAFEAKVAPENYKRPKALVTEAMKKRAIEEIDKCGIRESLPRRQATPEDISVNDIIFVDRGTKLADRDPLMELMDVQTNTVNINTMKKAAEITIHDFLKHIVPSSDKISIIVTQALAANRVYISAPVNPDAPNILKWDNNFAWSYEGDVTDSDIAANVKSKGGKIDGVLRFSIQWNEEGKDIIDLDAHAYTPKCHIFYSRKDGVDSGKLDVDIIEPKGVAVENIVWSDIKQMSDGIYELRIRLYSGHKPKGKVRAEVVFANEIYEYDVQWKGKEVPVATVIKTNGSFSIQHHQAVKHKSTAKEVPISIIMLSPNHWHNTKPAGNKHWFFLTNEKTEYQFRGFYNEFLNDKFHDHRKAFDLIASRMMCEPSENGLTGYGFSETKRAEVYFKANNKLFKVKF